MRSFNFVLEASPVLVVVVVVTGACTDDSQQTTRLSTVWEGVVEHEQFHISMNSRGMMDTAL